MLLTVGDLKKHLEGFEDHLPVGVVGMLRTDFIQLKAADVSLQIWHSPENIADYHEVCAIYPLELPGWPFLVEDLKEDPIEHEE
jgi:hypothetical protein